MQRCWLVMDQYQYLDDISYNIRDSFHIHMQKLQIQHINIHTRKVGYFNQ